MVAPNVALIRVVVEVPILEVPYLRALWNPLRVAAVVVVVAAASVVASALLRTHAGLESVDIVLARKFQLVVVEVEVKVALRAVGPVVVLLLVVVVLAMMMADEIEKFEFDRV